MARQDQTVEQMISALRSLQKESTSLQDSLFTRARLQEYTEIQFNELASVVRDGIELVQRLKKGDVVSEDWIARRDELVDLARRLIQDID
jgi:CHAD domain-containing protein